MDITQRLAQWAENDMRFESVALEAKYEIERLREALQKIADIEHEDIPAPRTPNEGTTWTVLAMAVGLAEKALKGDE